MKEKKLNLVLNKTTGRIHDVPDGHYSLNPGQWPRGRNPNPVTGAAEEGFAEEFEILDPSEYEYTMEAGWVKKTSSSRSTRTKNEKASSAAPSST